MCTPGSTPSRSSGASPGPMGTRDVQEGGKHPAPRTQRCGLVAASQHWCLTNTSMLGRESACLAGLARAPCWGDALVTVDPCLLKSWGPPLPTCFSVPGWEHPVALAREGSAGRAPVPLISIRPRCSRCSRCFGVRARHCLATTEQNYNSSPRARACVVPRACTHAGTRLLPVQGRGRGGWRGHPALLPTVPHPGKGQG